MTFLDPSGLRKADVSHPRRAIGPLGDGLLRLAPAAEHIGLAEGFETAWAASLLHDEFPIWATLGADRYAIVALPPIVRRVTIFADYDAPGLSAALSFFERRPELEVWIATPAMMGLDFARVWELRSSAAESVCARL
nr:toprim domain-containing protein [Methylocystis echinoides]